MIRFSALVPALTLGAALLAGAASARADEIRNPTASFAGLDKITGRIISFDVAIDETVQFGTLQITPRVCLTRPQTEAPLTEGFVEVDEVENVKQAKRIFSGWMFAASPGLHGVEHPVYDVWLKDCKGGKEVIASPANPAPDAGKAPPPNATPAPAPETPPRKARRTITPQNPVEPRVDIPPEPAPGEKPAAAPEQPAAAPENAPPSAGPAQAAPERQPAAQDNGLGAPVEVGPAPGARNPPGESNPSAPKPHKRRPKRKPPAPFVGAPQDAPPPGAEPQDDQPRRERLEPMTPNDLPGDTLYR